MLLSCLVCLLFSILSWYVTPKASHGASWSRSVVLSCSAHSIYVCIRGNTPTDPYAYITYISLWHTVQILLPNLPQPFHYEHLRTKVLSGYTFFQYFVVPFRKNSLILIHPLVKIKFLCHCFVALLPGLHDIWWKGDGWKFGPCQSRTPKLSSLVHQAFSICFYDQS